MAEAHSSSWQQWQSFHPNCTAPPSGTHIVGNPNIRSTFTIFYSSWSVILLSTYTILHLNIPVLRRPTENWSKWIEYKVFDLGYKLKWMLITIVTPELVFGKLSHDYQVVNQIGGNHVRSYMANMGYFVLDWTELVTDDGVHALLTDAVDKVLDGDLPGWQHVNVARLRPMLWALDVWQWEVIAEKGIAALPDTPGWQLQQHDGGSTITKSVAILSSLWLIVNVIARTSLQHESSQFEIASAAYAACSIFTWLLCLKHPQNVRTTQHIKASLPESLRDPTRLRKLIRSIGAAGPNYLWTRRQDSAQMDGAIGPIAIPDDSLHGLKDTLSDEFAAQYLPAMRYPSDPNYGLPIVVSDFGTVLLILNTCLTGLLFGAVHLTAWNATFPTDGEAVAWRACSLTSTILPGLAWFASFFTGCFPTRAHFSRHFAGGAATQTTDLPSILIRLCYIPYLLTRVFLIVESIRSLFYLSPSAFVSTWADRIPHVG